MKKKTQELIDAAAEVAYNEGFSHGYTEGYNDGTGWSDYEESLHE